MVTAALGENARLRGSALVLLSTVFFALSGVFTKAVGQTSWTILGWRGLIGGLLVLIYVVVSQKRAGRPVDLSLGRIGWTIAWVSAASAAFFIASFKLTSVANVVVIYALVPFMAAGLAWLWFGERVRARTAFAAAATLIGVFVTVAGSFGSGRLIGDLFAVAMTVGCAVYLILVRRYPDVPSVWASGAAALIVVPFAAVLGDYSAISPRDALLMTLFGICFAAALITWTEGARLIPAPEAGLMGAAEIPIAAVFAFAILGDVPTAAGVIGGLIVLAAVFSHALSDARPAETSPPA